MQDIRVEVRILVYCAVRVLGYRALAKLYDSLFPEVAAILQ